MNCSDLVEAVRRSPLAGWRCRADGDFVRVETPLRYPDGGTVELYIEDRAGALIVSDFGEAFRFLESAGLDPLRSPAREKMIDLAARLGNAAIDEGAIEIRGVKPPEILASLVKLGQVVTRVADLALQARGAMATTFADDLEDYLRTTTKGVEVRRRVVLEGASDRHEIDIVTKSAAHGQSAIESLSAPTANGANSQTAFTIKKFADIAALGRNAPNRFVVLDDSADVWTLSLRQQLARFADVIDWERRDRLVEAI